MMSGEWSKPVIWPFKRITTYQSGGTGPDGQGKRGERMQSGPIGGTQGEAGTGRRDSMQDTTHSHPPYGWSVHPSLWDGGITTRIPDLKFYLTKQF
jgi:hypothetical protein